ncbi:MAG: hypothetical protein KKE24_01750, partial [Candidatus Thermoplasmatota archaeon]|nr:hypothetical protein [Candidatus Thermoplasmatota archaeon]
GGRVVHEDLLPYPRFLAMPPYTLERKYEFILDVEVPEEKSAAGSRRMWLRTTEFDNWLVSPGWTSDEMSIVYGTFF